MKLIILFGALLALGACRPETDRATLTLWADSEYKAAYVAKHRKARYEIQNTSPTPEAAVQRVLDEFCAPDGHPENWIFGEIEQREILWPNLPAADWATPTSNPDAYWEVVITLRSVVWKRMLTYRGRCARVQRIDYRRPVEAYNALLIHFPGQVHVRDLTTGKLLSIEYFRDVVEHAGRFKVSQIAPD